MLNRTYALISDIHANLPALEAVLGDIAGGTPAGVYHLGDLVGYAPWPNECVARLRNDGIPGVAGNYDSTVATDYKHCGCRADTPRDEELAHISYEWTRRAVSGETKSFLGGLPFRIDIRPGGGHLAGPTIMLFHATPVSNLIYVTEDRSDGFLQKMAQQAGARSGDVICFGHTHVPWHRVVDGIHFINTGSVGRPKGGDPRACYVVLDMAGNVPVVGFARVEYDIERAAEGIVEAGLPIEFAEHLRAGGKKE
ncbi:MAG: metallophosphoesterase family protein [Gemmatimonadaceae bacterium]